MNAKDLAEHLIKIKDSCVETQSPTQQQMEDAVALVIKSSPRHMPEWVTQAKDVAPWRQAFTLWKAASNLLVKDKRWGDIPIGFQAQAAGALTNVFITHLVKTQPKLLLSLLNNNAFLGWTPDSSTSSLIAQAQWEHRGMMLPNKGLAINRMR